MTDQTGTSTNPPFSFSQVRDLPARAGLAVLAVAAILMPVMTASSFGVSQGLAAIDGRFVGALSLLVPLAFIAALFAPAMEQTRPLTRLIDIAAFAIALCVALYVAYSVYAGISQLAGMDRQLSAMMGGTGMRAPSLSGMVRLEPGYGIAPWVIVLAWSGWRAVAGLRN